MWGMVALKNAMRGKSGAMMPIRLIEVTLQLEHLHAMKQVLQGLIKSAKAELMTAEKVFGREVSHVAGGHGKKSGLQLPGTKPPIKPGQHPTKPGPHSVKPGQHPVKPGQNPVKPGQHPVKPGQHVAKPGANAAGKAAEAVPGWLRHDLILKERAQKWLIAQRNLAEHWAKQRLTKLHNAQHRLKLAIDAFNTTYHNLKMAPPHSVGALQAELKELGEELGAAMNAVAAA